MIKNIRIKNFKSLGEIHLPMEKFNCLIGMNGAGKSTVLQVFDFISQMMNVQVQDWLDNRGWSIHDLNCKLRKESNILLSVEFQTLEGKTLTWIGMFNRIELRCTSETVFLGSDKIFQATGQQFKIDTKWRDIAFKYQGSLLSVLKDSELPDPIKEFRDSIKRIRSLELLSPQLMRKSARINDIDIGAGGEKLAGFLYGIKGDARHKLVGLLKGFYPKLEDFKVTNQRAGWKKLSVIEQFEGHRLETEASHLSDGLLRILAVIAQSGSDRSLILLDEIENGINQEIIEKLVDTLVASPQQILVTTHSPLILNFLDDDLARESVQFIYKSPQGESRIRRFFEIPRIGEKLSYMGPGDAFVDTNLEALTEECIELDSLEKSPRSEEVE
ncbi:MAG: ATP-binding protein [Methylococcaceae bacterium]|nr:ATP-binding protein [Methylococcaceae bacterium]MDZ4155421.1 ATP-binding protein [Methylococcales bacterium]MDP2394283.1 ATP-binding protein [Methylococcaceae bacterium]MDP3019378.1 ATP-binding protein [Methylococcaceae bacterium]MDP3390632.1 ATP-binding protein [Methylococcaceae bacterium]